MWSVKWKPNKIHPSNYSTSISFHTNFIFRSMWRCCGFPLFMWVCASACVRFCYLFMSQFFLQFSHYIVQKETIIFGGNMYVVCVMCICVMHFIWFCFSTSASCMSTFHFSFWTLASTIWYSAGYHFDFKYYYLL